MAATERTDAMLVAESLGGDRHAFRQIVERYQTLICSIAYSATGNVSRSEDVAQETFIAAWSQLAALREPAKLRGWLCGIVWNRLHRDRREDTREVVRHAVELEDAAELAAPEASPADQAVSHEEEEIVWRSLERIPPLYREPLVLFYREHCSVAQVAGQLELSEETVKQRLSRGRKLLQDEVQALVENTLRRTVPGDAFSAAVIAKLPTSGTVGVATGVGALIPFLGIAAGVWAHWLVIRENSGNLAVRRKQIAQVIAAWVVYLGLAVGGERLVFWGLQSLGSGGRTRFVALALFWWILVAGPLAFQVVWLRRVQEGRDTPAPTARPMPGPILAIVSAGAHLALFSWLIVLCWREGDPLGVWAATGAMVVLGVIAYWRCFGRSGDALGRVAGTQTGLACAVILLLLNMRLGTWMAASRGITVAELAQVLPLWIVPVLTFALLIWAALLFALLRPWRSGVGS